MSSSKVKLGSDRNRNLVNPIDREPLKEAALKFTHILNNTWKTN